MEKNLLHKKQNETDKQSHIKKKETEKGITGKILNMLEETVAKSSIVRNTNEQITDKMLFMMEEILKLKNRTQKVLQKKES